MTRDMKWTRWKEAQEWWAPRRRAYNIRVILALVGAGVLYVALVSVKTFPPNAEIEVTPFTLAANALGTVLYVGIANVMYLAGPLIETIIAPSRVNRYREWSWMGGTFLAMALPFGPLAAVLLI